MQKDDSRDEVIRGRNMLLELVLGLIALAIINSLAFRFPGASNHLAGRFFVGDLIKTLTLVLMLPLVLWLRRPLSVFLAYTTDKVARSGQSPDRARTDLSLSRLSNGLLSVVLIAAIWPISLSFLGELLKIEGTGSLDWLKILAHLGFALLLVYYLYMAFRDLPFLLGVGPGRASSAACPGCGASNLYTARFCSSCGGGLQPAEVSNPGTPKCPACGNEARPGARFCGSCGASLAP